MVVVTVVVAAQMWVVVNAVHAAGRGHVVRHSWHALIAWRMVATHGTGTANAASIQWSYARSLTARACAMCSSRIYTRTRTRQATRDLRPSKTLCAVWPCRERYVFHQTAPNNLHTYRNASNAFCQCANDLAPRNNVLYTQHQSADSIVLNEAKRLQEFAVARGLKTICIFTAAADFSS